MFNLQTAVQEGALSQMIKDAIASIDYKNEIDNLKPNRNYGKQNTLQKSL
jgi:hypothetical protein